MKNEEKPVSVIYAFVKLFEKIEYAEDFVKGRLFMNTIRTFKEYRDVRGELRGDEYEGVTALYQPNKIGEIRLDDLQIGAADLALPIVVHGNDLLNHNVFCIYTLNSRGHDTITAETLAEFRRAIELHDLCFGLGNYCVVILNAREFIYRCKSSLERLSLKSSLGMVEYFNEHEFHGSFPSDRHGYQKRSCFAHQKEYRIKINVGSPAPGPYILEVGDLSDIAAITTPAEFNAKLEVSLPNGNRA